MIRQANMQALNTQRGISLVMALVMLVVLTLTAISSTSSVNSSIRIAGNMVSQNEALTATMMAIDSQLGKLSNFTTAVDRNVSVDVNRDGVVDYTVKLYAPVCYSTAPVPGDSYLLEVAGSTMNRTHWHVRAEVTAADTGAMATLKQGIRINLRAPTGC